MSPDPSGAASASLYDPQSFNLYAYALNNPLKFTDPTGLVCHWDDGTQDDSPSDGGAPYADCETLGGTWSEDASIDVTADDKGNQLDVTTTDSSGTFIDFLPSKGCTSALRTAGANSQAMVRYYQNYQNTITNAANSNGLQPSFLAAIAIRESGLQNIAQPDGQGRGLFQIDLGANPNVTAGQAFNVNFSANFAGNMLSNNRSTLAAAHPNLDPTHLMQAAAASYNFGTRNVSGNPNTIDAGTTGGNYGSNVMAISGSCFSGS